METIDILKPNVTLKEARQLLSTDGLQGLIRHLRLGRLRWIAQVYIPFDIFSLDIHRNGMVEEGVIAVDAVNGTLDPYSFAHPPADGECVALETRNALPRVISPQLSQQNAEQRVRRLLYQRGFFRISKLAVNATRQPLGIHVPYWVGFFGGDAHLHVAVIDAVRRQVEGAKVRELLQQWITGEFSRSRGAQAVAAAS